MNGLTAADFPAFFEAVHGYRPHLWQERLAKDVIDDGWPALLDLPTGAGKTAALDIALFAHAVDPAKQPRRVVFVVDRRLIVDQVQERADALADKLFGATDGPLGAVRSALGLAERERLGTSTLRGGLVDSEWARRPDLPWVISSTVDQVGSRLLFRGYGVSDSMKPIHAGLLGTDAVILLDEVHLSQAFAQTLRRLGQNHELDSAERPAVARPWKVVEMSATPGSDDDRSRFSLEEEDLAPGSRLHQILAASKPLTLSVVGKKSQRDDGLAIASEAAEVVESLGDVDSVGFVVNRVATARAVTAALESAGLAPLLLTGRMRPYDRAAVLADPRFKAVRNNAGPDERGAIDQRPVLVATQTIEVGADLDFGGLITECAPIDSLKQRFGRLDRSGERSATGAPVAAAVIATARFDAAKKPLPDPVYGEGTVQAAWAWLGERIPLGVEEQLDAGIGTGHLDDPPPDALSPHLDAPMLRPADLDLLVQTGPRPGHDPEVAPWLHGPEERDIDVEVVWRADIDEAEIDALSARTDPALDGLVDDYLRLVPIVDAERLALPLHAVRRWLTGQAPSVVADTTGVPEDDERRPPANRRALRVNRGRRAVVNGYGLQPGDVLIVPADRGGIDEFGSWAPESDSPVADVADLPGAEATEVPACLRLLPERFASLPAFSEFDDDAGTAEDRPSRLIEWRDASSDAPESDLVAVRALRALLAERDDSGRPTSRVVAYRLGTPRVRFVLIDEKRSTARRSFDGSDRVNSAIGREVPLDSHLDGVGTLAAEFGERCGLPSELVDDLRLAGQLHDLGKLDPRFQLLLRGGDTFAAAAGKPLAKSASRTLRNTPSREVDRYPKGQRHELLSLSLIEREAHLLEAANDPELVKHLVASHHGHCRPFPPTQCDPTPPAVTGTALGVTFGGSARPEPHHTGAESGDRFWGLVEKYGHYGLTWLEAIFRLADHRRSEAEANGE